MGEIIELMNPFKTIAESSDDAREYILRVNDSTNDLTRTVKDVATEFDSLSLSTLEAGTSQTKFLNEMIRLGHSVEDSKALFQTYVKLRKEQAGSEQLLATATATATQETKTNTAEVEKQAAARQKAHEQRIKQLRKEAEESQKKETQIFSKLGAGATRDAFNPQTTDVSKQMTPERLQMISNASARVLEINKQLAVSMSQTFTAKMTEQVAAYNAQVQLTALETQQINTNLQTALPFGSLLADSFMQMAESGKLSFQSIFQGLKKMAIQLAATVAAAFALNILLGGIGIAGFGKGTGGFKNLLGGMGGGGPLGGLIPFANGGIVSGPTSALVGEYTGARTNPEVIAPLNKLQNMMGGNVTFTISGDSLVGTLNRANKTRARKF
jgi:hypothetical protein